METAVAELEGVEGGGRGCLLLTVLSFLEGEFVVDSAVILRGGVCC